MGHYEHYIDVAVTPTMGHQIWYFNLNGELTEYYGARRFQWTSTTSGTITAGLVYANYSGTWVINKYVEDNFTITTSAGTGGTLTASANSAAAGTTITLTVTPSSGYVFKDFTKTPSNLSISNNKFTMPSQNVSIKANFRKISTGSLSKSSMNGGESVTLTITTESTAYSHKYNLSFGTGMATGDVSVAAGTKKVMFTVPLNWSAQIPNATSKSGGTLTLKTYNGSTLIGSSTITGLTYNVPASVVPTIGTITTSIARTISGTTYANIGNIYTQNHCGVQIQASASGAQSSTIASMKVTLSGYSGNKYTKTVASSSINFTTGLLTVSGTTTITVTATDSRGRTASKTATISVAAYAAPAGSLTVRRVDSNGDPDDMGLYGTYTLTKQYSSLSNLNTLTWTLSCSGSTASSPANSGDLMPGNRLLFNETQEYPVTLTLTDAFETTVITANLKSARFILAFDASGNKIGVMKYPNQNIPSGKARTFEFSADTQIYIGSKTLEQFIRDTMNS